MEALKRWAACIGYQPVVVLTDHQALQSWYKEKVDTPSGPAGWRARWHELLSKFDIEVKYIPGAMNTVADALSRWAYPASKGLQDVLSHGSLADWAAVQKMSEEERCEVACFGVHKLHTMAEVKPADDEVPAGTHKNYRPTGRSS